MISGAALTRVSTNDRVGTRHENALTESAESQLLREQVSADDGGAGCRWDKLVDARRFREDDDEGQAEDENGARGMRQQKVVVRSYIEQLEG